MEGFPRLQISAEQPFPVLTNFRWDLGIAIAGEIHQKTAIQVKKIQVLGASRRFADKREAAAIGK